MSRCAPSICGSCDECPCDYYQCDVGTVLNKHSDSIRELTVECSTIVTTHRNRT